MLFWHLRTRDKVGSHHASSLHHKEVPALICSQLHVPSCCPQTHSSDCCCAGTIRTGVYSTAGSAHGDGTCAPGGAGKQGACTWQGLSVHSSTAACRGVLHTGAGYAGDARGIPAISSASASSTSIQSFTRRMRSCDGLQGSAHLRSEVMILRAHLGSSSLPLIRRHVDRYHCHGA